MKMKNAVVLVTGANRGLGRALVEECLQAGARRIYAGARDPQQLEAMVRSAPEKIVPLALDITDPRSLQAAADAAADVAVLFNNAGVLSSYNVLTSSAEQIAQDFTTNVFGSLASTKAFLPALERAAAAQPGAAAIINMLSVAALASLPMLGGYSASKAAAFSITQALRGELGKKGISVHAVLAGTIDTDMVRGFDTPKASPESVAKSILEGVEAGLEDILPDPMSRDLFAIWKSDPKAFERTMASMAG